jgi:hypothetical protein
LEVGMANLNDKMGNLKDEIKAVISEIKGEVEVEIKNMRIEI